MPMSEAASARASAQRKSRRFMMASLKAASAAGADG